MKSLIESIKDILPMSSLIKYHEGMHVVDFIIEIGETESIGEAMIKKILTKLPSRDDFLITISNDAEYGLQINKNSDLDKFDWSIFEGDKITMTWHIDKNIIDNKISVYCFEKFCDEILSKKIIDIMLIFSTLLDERNYLQFETLDKNINYVTKSISFIGAENCETIKHSDRLNKLNLVRENTNFKKGYRYSLLPDDFSFQITGDNNRMEDCFYKIEMILSLCYIANEADITSNELLNISVSGQRNICFELDPSEINFNNEVVKIYNWIYEGGNSTDKAIIARNIISLHCRFSSIIDLDEKTFSSIQSNYNLYQKENVDRYLDLKSEVGKNITQIIEKTYELGLSIPYSIKNNFLAVFSFLFTVILANIVSDVPLDNIFTRDVTVIFETIIFFSIIYLLFSVYETNYKIKQMKVGFNKLKDNYKDVFDEKELNTLVCKDSFEKETIGNIKKSMKKAIIIWIVLLIILIIIVETNSSDPSIDNIINFFIKVINKKQ